MPPLLVLVSQVRTILGCDWSLLHCPELWAIETHSEEGGKEFESAPCFYYNLLSGSWVVNTESSL
jgi:hypothetical protein